jgi:predicted esterase
MRRFIFILVAIMSVSVSAAFAQEAQGGEPVATPGGQTLKPGIRIILKFPELPKTLFAMKFEKDMTPQVCIALPENYTDDRKFPLFVFMWGGDGGDCTGPGKGQSIMSNRGCIFVNLPLFKKKWDSNGPFKGLLIDIKEDVEVICGAYSAMLKKVYETIPNIDTENNIIGGMSNGAHTIVALFEHGDKYLTGLFKNLILAEGGYYLISTYENYKDKNILYMYGDYVGVEGWVGMQGREEFPAVIKKFSEAAASHSLKTTAFVMPNTGHEVPPKFDPDIRKWVNRQLGK